MSQPVIVPDGPAIRALVLFYLLARDHLPTGKVEELLSEAEALSYRGVELQSGGLADLARGWAVRLLREDGDE